MIETPGKSGKKRSDGEGSVHQIHEPGCQRPAKGCKCKWRGVLVIGYKPGKKPGAQLAIRKTVTATTKSGAANRLRELRETHAAQTLPHGKAPTVQQWLNHWHGRILPRRAPKASTIATYRGTIDNYLIPLLGHHRVDRLRPEDIDEAWDVLRTTGNPLKAGASPLSANTIHHTHVVLRRALRVAVQRKIISTSPASPDAMDAPAAEDHEVEPLAAADWKAILEAARDVENSARWTVALAVGLRQGEAVGLRWEDVDLDDGMIRVRRTLARIKGRGLVATAPKSQRSRRDIAIPPQLVTELRAHRKSQAEARLHAGDRWNDSGYVFTLANGDPIDPRLDQVRWTALLEKADVPHRKLHTARHTAATILLIQGVSPRTVMDMMGWSQASTAAKYQHVVDELQRDAASRMGAALWG